jgi:hypothetical protein
MICFIRHSKRLDQENIDLWLNSKRKSINPYDIPLASNGGEIAKKIIEKILSDYTGDFSYIYSSPITRCIQTSLEIQNFIQKKYNIKLLIRVEYGLCFTRCGCCDLWFDIGNVSFDGEYFQQKKIDFIDDMITNKNIYKKFGKKNFDTQYKSIVKKNKINKECSYIESITNRLDFINEFKKNVPKNKMTLMCTHCENLGLMYSYIKGVWNLNNVNKFSGDNYCSHIMTKWVNNSFVLE